MVEFGRHLSTKGELEANRDVKPGWNWIPVLHCG
jgi:hypothetical protein